MPRIATTTTGQTNLDAPITPRAAIVDYTAARAALLPNLDTTVSSREARTPAATYQSAGLTASSGANTIHADSGALAAGRYRVNATVVQMPYGTSVSGQMQIQYRDAANSSNLLAATTRNTSWDSSNGIGVTGGVPVSWVVAVAVNERFRIEQLEASAGASAVGWSISVVAVP